MQIYVIQLKNELNNFSINSIFDSIQNHFESATLLLWKG